MTQRQVFFSWAPLAAMWIIMAVEQPAITAVIARLDAPVLQLAAFGVTFSLGLIIEGPVIQLLSTGTALTVDIGHYRKILGYIHWMSAILVGLHLLFALTPLLDFVVASLLSVPEEIVEPSRRAFLLMTPWAPAIAYRRYFQGVLIRYGKSRVVPITMIARVVALAAVLAVVLVRRSPPGAEAGAIALSFGVVVAAISAYVFVRPVVKHAIPRKEVEAPLTLAKFVEFYLPLALTSVIALAARPVLTLGIARAPYPLESLAVWPVLMGFIFMANSMALAYQEVVISQSRIAGAEKGLKSFARKLAISLVAILAVAIITPFDDWWFFGISGLDRSFRQFTNLPMFVLFVTPVFVTGVAWYRGLFVYNRKTPIITQAVVIHTAGLVVGTLVLGAIIPLPGVFSSSCAYTLALIAEVLYFMTRKKRLPPETHRKGDPSDSR